MADNRKFVATKVTRLSSAASASDTSITVASVQDREDNTLTMTDFGTKAFGVIDPGGDNEEMFSFTGISSTTLSGVSHVTMKTPYTESSGLNTGHAAGVKVILHTNSPAFYDEFLNKNNDETITGTYTFTSTAIPIFDSDPTLTDDKHVATKKYADDLAIAGAPDSAAAVKGLLEQATIAEASANAADGSGDTTAPLAITTELTSNTSGAAQIIPVTDADGDIPVEFMELDANWTFSGEVDIDTATNFKLGGTAYTGTMADLNEAEAFFGATDITGAEAETLTDGSDASQLHEHAMGFGVTTRDLTTATGSQTIAHGLGVTPRYVKITCKYGTTNGSTDESVGIYDGTSTAMIYVENNGTLTSGNSTTNIAEIQTTAGNNQVATCAVDGTNITLSWTKTGTPSGTAQILWEAYA